MKVLLKRFYLNGYTIGSHPQTQELELHAEVLLGNTIKFHPQIQKVRTAFIHVFMTDAGRLRVNGLCFGFLFRWKVIADYVNMHSKTGTERDSKHVIKKVKNLKKLGLSHAFFTLFM